MAVERPPRRQITVEGPDQTEPPRPTRVEAVDPQAVGPAVPLHDDRIQQRLEGLLHAIGRGAAGDFSEKPPMPDEADPLFQFTVALRFLLDDVEQSKRERDQALARLREADAVRGRLLRTAVHEIRTPLTPLRLKVAQLERLARDWDEHPRRCLTVIERQVERLDRLTEDLLDRMLPEKRRLSIEPRRMGATRLLETACEDFQEAADRQGVSLRVRVEEELHVQADPLRLMQVFHNLLSNALRATPTGGRIELRAVRRKEQVIFQVKDSGEGMTQQQMERLFVPSAIATGEESPAPAAEGSEEAKAPHGMGLGLYICKGIVETHGGLIWCESHGPGLGSVFSFLLPLDKRSE